MCVGVARVAGVVTAAAQNSDLQRGALTHCYLLVAVASAMRGDAIWVDIKPKSKRLGATRPRHCSRMVRS